jgi:hypothetical protein
MCTSSGSLHDALDVSLDTETIALRVVSASQVVVAGAYRFFGHKQTLALAFEVEPR